MYRNQTFSEGPTVANMPESAWKSRGYLPHCDREGLTQLVTFRLADSLPAEVLERLASNLEAEDPARSRWLHEMSLDQGYGKCWLRQPAIAQIVEDALLHFDGTRYRMISWVIMPNHVHALAELSGGWRLEGIVHSWKSFTARKANEVLDRSGPFWARDYHDRFIRNPAHLRSAIRYIHRNPVKARLVRRPNRWFWSSARRFPPEQLLELDG